MPSHALDKHSNTLPNAPTPAAYQSSSSPDVPSHTDESVSMLLADIESARTERHHAQLHSDELQSGEWFQEHIDNNTEPCGPRILMFCLPCWCAEVANAKGEVNSITEIL